MISIFALVSLLGAAAMALDGPYCGQLSTRSEIMDDFEGPPAYDSVNCYVDQGDDRIMEEFHPGIFCLTTELCAAICSGWAFFGTQYGHECWCGDSVGIYTPGSCDYDCAGDDSEKCGGYYSMSVYQYHETDGPTLDNDNSTPGVPTPEPATAPPTTAPPDEDEVCVDGILKGDTCCSVATVTFTTDSIELTKEGGCATLTTVYNAQDNSGPLYVLDSNNNIVSGGGGIATPTGYWLLKSNLHILEGVTLDIHGTSVGGDADVLRIQSTDTKVWEIFAWGGNLSFEKTVVTSWDTDMEEERTKHETGRSFIKCITELGDTPISGCDGGSQENKGECRMDIIDSTIGNLGWSNTESDESYGLTWKVRGLCDDLSNKEIFDYHDVYGDIQGSEIHGMYYGVYSYGHQGGVWTNNVIRDNVIDGFHASKYSDDLTIGDNAVYGNGGHGIIASEGCKNVEIYRNEIFLGTKAGIFLNRGSDHAKVYDNYVHDNGDAGIALMESFGADIHSNVIENCLNGIRLTLGSADNNIYENLCDFNVDYGLYITMGSDEPSESFGDGRPNTNVFNANIISNTAIGLRIQEADDNTFTNNVFTEVDTFEIEESSGNIWTSNDIGSACLDGTTDLAGGFIPSC